MSIEKEQRILSFTRAKRGNGREVLLAGESEQRDVLVWERRPWWERISWLWICLGVALAVRLWFLVYTHGTMDGDEALLGIQAEHILQGERPIYFYGIPYFGSLEAYVAAGIFALVGPSVAALRVEATLFGLLLVGVTWWFATLLADAAGLSWRAKRVFVFVAGLGAALPPLYDGIVEMRTGGGWIESFVIMMLLLIAAHRLTTRWREGAARHEQIWRWMGIGLLVGVGMWIYPLVSIAILAAALWILFACLSEIVVWTRAGEALPGAVFRAFSRLILAVAAIPACLVGFAPGIVWGMQNNWANLHYIFGLGGGWNLARLQTIARVGEEYAGCVAPRVVGGGTPLEGSLLGIIHAPLVLCGVVCIFGSLGLVVASFWRPVPLLVRARRLVLLPALFGVCSAMLYCLSSASASILISCNADFGGHYAAPLVLALPFFLATMVTLAGMALYGRRSEARDSNNAVQEGVTGHAGGINGTLAVLCVVLVAYFGAQGATYGLTNPDLAFQSAYCTIAPADYAPIIAYMEQEHIHYAWATNLLGYQISFETDNRIIVADPLALIHPAISINRIPAYTIAVAAADRASFLVFVRHGDAHPALLSLLDSEHVTYRDAVFPSQAGVDVMVVTPLSRTVSPFTSPAFDIFYCSAQ